MFKKIRWSGIMVVLLLFGTGQGKSLPKGDKLPELQAEETHPARHASGELAKNNLKTDENERGSVVKTVEEIPLGEHALSEDKNPFAELVRRLSTDMKDPIGEHAKKLSKDKYDFTTENHPTFPDFNSETPNKLEGNTYKALKPVNGKYQEFPTDLHTKHHSFASGEISMDPKSQKIPKYFVSKFKIPADPKAQKSLTLQQAKDFSTAQNHKTSIDPKPQEVPTFHHVKDPSKASQFATPNSPEFPKIKKKQGRPMDSSTNTEPITPKELHDLRSPEFENIQEAPKHPLSANLEIPVVGEIEEIPKAVREKHRPTAPKGFPGSLHGFINPWLEQEAKKLWKRGLAVAQTLMKEIDGRLAYLKMKGMPTAFLRDKFPGMDRSSDKFPGMVRSPADIWEDILGFKERFDALTNEMKIFAKARNFDEGEIPRSYFE